MSVLRGRPIALVGAAVIFIAVIISSAGTLADADERSQAGQPSGNQPSAYVGEQTCLTCHAEIGTQLARTLHGRSKDPRSPASAQGCETCHGPGARTRKAAIPPSSPGSRRWQRGTPTRRA